VSVKTLLSRWTTTTGGFGTTRPAPTIGSAGGRTKSFKLPRWHAQGLSDLSPSTLYKAVLKQGFLTYCNVQLDDVEGLQDRYGEYNP